MPLFRTCEGRMNDIKRSVSLCLSLEGGFIYNPEMRLWEAGRVEADLWPRWLFKDHQRLRADGDVFKWREIGNYSLAAFNLTWEEKVWKIILHNSLPSSLSISLFFSQSSHRTLETQPCSIFINLQDFVHRIVSFHSPLVPGFRFLSGEMTGVWSEDIIAGICGWNIGCSQWIPSTLNIFPVPLWISSRRIDQSDWAGGNENIKCKWGGEEEIFKQE